MNDDRFDDFLREAARDYHRPPEPPREKMWTRIRELRRAPRRRAVWDGWDRWRWARPPLRRLPAPLVWAGAMAAVLTIGVGIGRLSVGPRPSTRDAQLSQSAAESAAVAAPGESEMPNLAYRVATIEHLGKAEALLTTLRTETVGRADVTIGGWAVDLLGTTRMLLDSPAANDAQLRALLDDLELVLAQIVALGAARNSQDLELIRQVLEQRDVMTRLRTTIPAGGASPGT